MHGPRSFEAVKKDAAFRLTLYLREHEKNDQKTGHDEGHQPPHRSVGLFRAA